MSGDVTAEPRTLVDGRVMLSGEVNPDVYLSCSFGVRSQHSVPSWTAACTSAAYAVR